MERRKTQIRGVRVYTNGWKITYILVNIFPSIMLIYQTITVLSLFIPITGRIGNDKNADIIVGVMFASLIIIISSFYIHFVTLMKRPLWLIYVFFATFLIHVAIVVSPLGFPYTGNPVSPAPQRFMIYHTSRTFEQEGVVKQDSGYFVVNLDRRSPKSVIPYVRQFEKRVPLIEDCKNFLVCGLPLSTPRMLAIMETNTWIPAEQPVIEEDISLHLNSKTFQRPNILSYYFTATGPDHFNIYLSPKLNIRLLNTSFDSIVPENVPIWNNRPIYFVNYVWGVSKAPLNFRIDLEVPKNWNGTSIEIGISGKGVHDARNRYTVQFRSFLDDFPKWADIIRAVANFKSWEM